MSQTPHSQNQRPQAQQPQTQNSQSQHQKTQHSHTQKLQTPQGAPREPVISYDPALPISDHAEQIKQLIDRHQVIVVAGETGSGKTTQLPKMCLQAGRGHIGHTQPRRIAARSVAERLADELQVSLGSTVGYQVRFTRQASSDTAIKVMTDGVMLAEINHDRLLRRYDTIIIDEAHERSLNIDFLLGYLKQLLPQRPDLKVIITSATIDTVRFAEHFADASGEPAPIVEVSGRTYPVEVRYRPPVGADEVPEDADMPASIVQAVRELGPTGDVLVFLSGEREIKDATEALEAAKLSNAEIVPLYARLSAAEQHRVFAAHTTRRIVLATNVAETSLTVPGIRYVIDTGLARISRYSARTKVQRLPIEPISRASADQRAGRCGRIAPGICIRLYSEDDYLARPEFTEPEILRTNLASVILKMAQARLGDIASFPFVEAPDRAQVNDGLRLLTELGALKNTDRHHPVLTKTGHRLAEMPIDPRLGRMLIEASRLGCLREVEIIVSGLAIQDVRERPAEKRQQADQLHQRFFNDDVLTARQPSAESPSISSPATPARYTPHSGRAGEFTEKQTTGPGGDIIAIWRLWRYLSIQRKALSGNQFRRLCRSEFINYLRVREWQDLRTQLRQIDKDLKLERNHKAGDTDAILTSVLAGLLSQVGLLEERAATKQGTKHRGKKPRRGPREYLGARGSHFAIQPGSALAKNPPELVMAVELVETSRLWARVCAPIEASWIDQIGGHLLKHNYSEPHWSSSSAGVLAYQRSTLYGVPVIADRLVDYGRIDPIAAREIFIRIGLVEGSWTPDDTHAKHGFMDHNAAMRTQVEDLEERTRRRDLLVDDQTIFDFYDARIPADVHSASTFDAWWSKTSNHHLLDLSMDDLIRPDADDVDAQAFPDRWKIGQLSLPVSYVFDPGAGADGVTVTVRLAELNQLNSQPFSWQVPGLRAELATELIRSLPKQIRTSLVPAPDHAREALRWLKANHPDRNAWFSAELGRALAATSGVQIPTDAWAPDKLPDHLRVSFQISEKGRITQRSKDLDQLKQTLAKRVSATLTKVSQAQATTGATSWIFDEIPTTKAINRRGLKAVGYPALRDDGDSVALIIADSPKAQAISHAAGIRRLLVLTNPDPTRWVVSHLGAHEKLWLGYSPYSSVAQLLEDARLKAADRAARAYQNPADIRTESAYEQLALHVRQDQADVMAQVVATASQALSWAQQIRRDAPRAPEETRRDVIAQLEDLIFKGFISYTRDPWYSHLPRYLQAASLRVDAAIVNPARDSQQMQVIDELIGEYEALCDDQPAGPLSPDVEDIGFLIEELRVQTFAQQLRTSVTVSPKRIMKAIERIRANQ